jgi:hypothetical protein
MKKVVFACFILFSVPPCFIFSLGNVRIISNNSLVIIKSSAVIYRDAAGNSKDSAAGLLDVFIIRNDRVVNGRIGVLYANNAGGWVGVEDTSYIENLSWKKFEKINFLEISLPGDLKFNYTPGAPVSDSLGWHVENRLENKSFFIDIYYIEGREDFDIDNQETNNSPYTELDYYGNEAYFNSGYGEEGNLYYCMYIVQKNRKHYFSVSVILPDYPPVEGKESTANRILFSVRIKDSQGPVNSNGRIYTITGDDVNVRAGASKESKVLTTLSKGARVALIERSDRVVTIGDKKGRWVYIDTFLPGLKKGETLRGWIFDYYLKAP